MSADAYLRARDEFQAIQKRVGAIAAALQAVAGKLESAPNELIFANAAAALPMETVMSPRTLSFNAQDWPTPDHINQLLVEWHAKRSDMMAAWNAIPASQRSAFQAPFAQPSRGY